eukprot:TRINITY_DN4615_c0_g1_i1.p1 TRINITY_DN4615_c0_g1~~TRINITY_DN4615_c0_g1_i1.p1  ORF type:complete len:169 (-),score=16.17 TRINITY_DN4615_c0_g1_i1:173-634(-)
MPYPFKPIPYIQEFLLSRLDPLSNEDLYARSKEIEDGTAAPEKLKVDKTKKKKGYSFIRDRKDKSKTEALKKEDSPAKLSRVASWKQKRGSMRMKSPAGSTTTVSNPLVALNKKLAGLSTRERSQSWGGSSGASSPRKSESSEEGSVVTEGEE